MYSSTKRYFWMIFALAMAACSLGAPNNTKPTQDTETKTLSSQMTSTTFTNATETASPKRTISARRTPSPTYTPSPTKTRAPTRTQLPLFVVKGLQVTYSFKGNIYIQDSGGQPIKVTNSGSDSNAMISDDGRKIVFRRTLRKGPPPELKNIYSINADGSNEQVLITNEVLFALNPGYNKGAENDDLFFVPGTHKIIFNTHSEGAEGSAPNNDLLIGDTDTAKITLLIAPRQAYHFKLSPNGKMIAVQANDHIDIINLQGQILHRNLITYPYDENLVWMPIFWTQDSKQLIVLPAISLKEDPKNTFYPLVYRAIWKYPLDGRKPVEIRLDPLPMANTIIVSPDGKWIAYMYTYNPARTDDESKFGLYLGNLETGTSKLFHPIAASDNIPDLFAWSPNSSYFFTEDSYQYTISLWDLYGNVTNIPLHRVGFTDWLDDNHYLYDGDTMGDVRKNSKVSVIQDPGWFRPGAFLYDDNLHLP